ncbi:DUF1376 domain-containing protein [Methylotenera sp.]|uniref:DUF1376 domain-containing protein n=1 Tax=Methylotenera sp. TaxID=2051956 RepID=UPI002732C385|nr:DUF1376 domain-containing protein [Methylotenera sp.]MDP3210000.1 DUF1376 domain-containing protein [Methylotenera sp.]
MVQATKKKNDRLAWFKFDAGSFIMDTTGLSTRHAGVYIRLLSVYWVSGCTMPDDDVKLKRMLGVSGHEDEEAMTAMLDEFFPHDGNGKRYHADLDRQLADVVGYSKQQAERGKLRHSVQKPTAKVGVQAVISTPSHVDNYEDF